MCNKLEVAVVVLTTSKWAQVEYRVANTERLEWRLYGLFFSIVIILYVGITFLRRATHHTEILTEERLVIFYLSGDRLLCILRFGPH